MTMRPNMGALLAPDLEQMIRDGDTEEVRAALERLYDPELADVLTEVDPRTQVVLLRLMSDERAAEIFTFLPEDQQRRLFSELGNEEIAGILNEMAPDDRTEIFEELPDKLVARLLSSLDPIERRRAKALLQFPPESVGRLATPEFVTVRPEWTVSEVLAHVRRQAQHAETFDVLYVVDERGRLLDDVTLQEVVLAEPEQHISDLMDSQYVSLLATDDRERAVEMMERYDEPIIPVVDRNNVLVGIVTFDDVADVAQVEVTEDFHKAAAVAPLTLDYSQTGVWSLYRRRVGWLVTLVLVNLVSSGIIAAYEEMLQATIALAFFLPLLIDSGGNTGSQAATLMVRALATRDVELSEWLFTLLKELRVGLTLGATMAVASGALGWLRGGFEIGLVVGASMLCIVVVANMVGVLLPFVLTRMRWDPAVASSPLITTLADAAGLLLYFAIAAFVLGQVAAGGDDEQVRSEGPRQIVHQFADADTDAGSFSGSAAAANAAASPQFPPGGTERGASGSRINAEAFAVGVPPLPALR